MNAAHLIAAYGYCALLALVAAESLCAPVPGETALIIAGTYAGTTHHLNPWAVFAVASAVAVIGDSVGYWVGDKGGCRLARRYGHKVRLDERKLKTARYLFGRHGVPVVFFGRLASVLRTYAAFLAGTSKMRWRKFPARQRRRRHHLGRGLHGRLLPGRQLAAAGLRNHRLDPGRRGSPRRRRGMAAGQPPGRAARRAGRAGLPGTAGKPGPPH